MEDPNRHSKRGTKRKRSDTDSNTERKEQKRPGHTGHVLSVAFSPNGERVASGSADNTVRICDAATGKLQRELKGHSDWVMSVAFSPSGALVASGSWDRTVRILNLDTNECKELKGHSKRVWSVAFSPDGGRVASGSSDSTVRIWDAATGQLQRELKGPRPVISVAFSPNGERVATGSNDSTVRIWDAATGQLQRELKGHSSGVFSVAFSPNGAQVASGSWDNTVRIWNVATEQPQGCVCVCEGTEKELKGHTDYVMSVAFSPNGERVASGSRDGTIRVWNAQTGQPIGKELKCHESGVAVWSVSFSPVLNKNIVASADYNTVQIWEGDRLALIKNTLDALNIRPIEAIEEIVAYDGEYYAKIMRM